MKRSSYLLFLSCLLFLTLQQVTAGTTGPVNGSKLWFSNVQANVEKSANLPLSVYIPEETPAFRIIKSELQNGLASLFKTPVSIAKKINSGSVFVGTSAQSAVRTYFDSNELKSLGHDGFIIRSFQSPDVICIAANTETAAMYGTFHFLRMLQTSNSIQEKFNITEIPSYQRRILNHWDNLDGTVERGYAGYSIFWRKGENDLAVTEADRVLWAEYAKANASVGINGTVLNNVNANPEILSQAYLAKAKTIAEVMRPYGIKVYLAVNFSSPEAIGGLKTADPLNEDVRKWWKNKADEIYQLIPDFGGFLVKANSEGLPGPQDFGRTHADGANMLAEALAPHNGIVMWRAFVYNPSPDDRAKQAYNEFIHLDGTFHKNVIIQVKNGPIDFQPREPFSPLFGSMKHTTLMPELQITQEYLGFSNHLAYLGTMFREFLDADTYTFGANSTVARITDGSVFNDSITAIAGVANIGLDTNWCGHHFAQSNWYVFGRLAWNNSLKAEDIAAEWLKQTFSHNPEFVNDLTQVMMQSREAVVNYMTPIGLHHLMGWSHHHGPEPWCVVPGARPDWLPSYYHNADSSGIGFDRSASGSNAVEQYAEPLRSVYNNPKLCPESLLLWFHHLPWDYRLENGNDLWTELCYKYSSGVNDVKRFQQVWARNQSKVDPQRFQEVKMKLATQTNEAIWWRDACLLYFQTFSGRPIPLELDQPIHQLEQLKTVKFNMGHHN